MSKTHRIQSVFSITMGLAMIGWWSLLLAADQMSELETAPLTAALHLAAEFLTALSLLAGGIGALRGAWWAHNISTLSLGMLLYAMVQASGYSAEHGQVLPVVIFATSVVTVLIFISRMPRREWLHSGE